MNIMILLEMAADSFGDRIAVGSVDQGLTYEELFARAGAAAATFRESGQTNVVLCDESSAAVPIALFGAAWASMPYVPLNYRLPDDELKSLAARCAPAVAIAQSEGAARLDGSGNITTLLRDELLSSPGEQDAPSRERDWSMDPEQIAVLLFTSGTTGAPKSAVLRHRHLVSYILGSVGFMGAEEDEAAIVSVPPYHIAGVSAMLSSVYAGRRIVPLAKFDADEWIDTVERENVTHAMVVPTMLARIVDALDARGGEPMLGVRALSYGGGKMPLRVIRKALELFPITSFVNAYGLTETSSTITLLGPDEHRVAQYSDDPAEQQRLASVGRPLPGIELAVRDDNGCDVPAGSAGSIFVRGEQVAGEYLSEGSVLDSEGWFPTRDGGYVDESGYLHVTGRQDDLIIRGGENLSPGEIEDVLMTHPAVMEAAAIGLPDTDWGEKVVAVVVLDSHGPSEAELQDLVRQRLRSSRVPQHVVVVDVLPYNDTGKLLRRVLRDDHAHLGDDTVS